jgi:hypothetical protein
MKPRPIFYPMASSAWREPARTLFGREFEQQPDRQRCRTGRPPLGVVLGRPRRYAQNGSRPDLCQAEAGKGVAVLLGRQGSADLPERPDRFEPAAGNDRAKAKGVHDSLGQAVNVLNVAVAHEAGRHADAASEGDRLRRRHAALAGVLQRAPGLIGGKLDELGDLGFMIGLDPREGALRSGIGAVGMVGHRQSPPLIGEAPVPASADAHIYANIAYCIKGAGMKNFLENT